MILAIGDSNMYPACTESQQPIDQGNMVPIFSKLLDQPFRCWSKNGASNYWIQAHIDYFLHDTAWPADTLLLVGWTSFEREEWPWLYSNISMCNGPDFGVPPAMFAKYTTWKQTLTEEYVQNKINFWHDTIYQLHLHLLSRQIRHVFWTTYDNFKSVPTQMKWQGCFYKPYDTDGCMQQFFANNKLNANPGDSFHYDQSAHGAWAQELATYARST